MQDIWTILQETAGYSFPMQFIVIPREGCGISCMWQPHLNEEMFADMMCLTTTCLPCRLLSADTMNKTKPLRACVREGQVAIGLDGEHLAEGLEVIGEGHVTASVVVGEHHEVVGSITLAPVRVLLLHMLQRFPHQL